MRTWSLNFVTSAKITTIAFTHTAIQPQPFHKVYRIILNKAIQINTATNPDGIGSEPVPGNGVILAKVIMIKTIFMIKAAAGVAIRVVSKITLDDGAECTVAVADGLMVLVILIMGKRGDGAEAVMAVIIKIHARDLTGAETIRGGIAELGHQAAAGPVEGLGLMILAAGMFVQDFEAVVEIAYLFKAYIVYCAFKHPVKRGAGVLFHPPASGIVAVFGNELQGGLAAEPGRQIFAVGGA